MNTPTKVFFWVVVFSAGSVATLIAFDAVAKSRKEAADIASKREQDKFTEQVHTFEKKNLERIQAHADIINRAAQMRLAGNDPEFVRRWEEDEEKKLREEERHQELIDAIKSQGSKTN